MPFRKQSAAPNEGIRVTATQVALSCRRREEPRSHPPHNQFKLLLTSQVQVFQGEAGDNDARLGTVTVMPTRESELDTELRD